MVVTDKNEKRGNGVLPFAPFFRYSALSAVIQLLDNLVVFLELVVLEGGQVFAAAVGQHDETAARVEILPVGAQVLGEMRDAGGEESDLDFGRTGVRGAELELFDDIGFDY
jgi:hypothetical protein